MHLKPISPKRLSIRSMVRVTGCRPPFRCDGPGRRHRSSRCQTLLVQHGDFEVPLSRRSFRLLNLLFGFWLITAHPLPDALQRTGAQGLHLLGKKVPFFTQYFDPDFVKGWRCRFALATSSARCDMVFPGLADWLLGLLSHQLLLHFVPGSARHHSHVLKAPVFRLNKVRLGNNTKKAPSLTILRCPFLTKKASLGGFVFVGL